MKGVLKLEDGRELTIELNDEALDRLKEPKKTGYEKVAFDEKYWFFGGYNVNTSYCDGGIGDQLLYENANYYSDETIAKNNARADTLMRKLRRFAAEHREKELGWNDETQLKYEIYYYHKGQDIKISPCQTCQNFGSIHFDTQEAAKAAIKEFKDELIWYFTEYKDSL